MSVKYSLVELKNPLKPMDPLKVYAKAQVRDEISTTRIAEDISYATSLTDGDVLNVIRALIRKIKEHLADGDIVCLDDLGKFQFQLSSKGALSFDEFTTANIRKARFQFRPGNGIKAMLPTLKYERVISVKARQEAKKAQNAAKNP